MYETPDLGVELLDESVSSTFFPYQIKPWLEKYWSSDHEYLIRLGLTSLFTHDISGKWGVESSVQGSFEPRFQLRYAAPGRSSSNAWWKFHHEKDHGFKLVGLETSLIFLAKKKSHFYDTSWLVFTNPPLCTTWHFKHHHLQTCNPMKQFAHSRPLTPNAVGCYPKFGQRNPTSLRRSMGIHKGNLQKVGHCCTAALSWFWTSTSDL